MTRTVDITPDKTLISKLGRTGYRTEQAVAELVDNAIDARLDGAKEKIAVDLDFRGGRIAVSDDGRGMGSEALGDAFTIARYADKGGLGRCGIGMKSACSSLGKTFRVSTTEAGSGTMFTAEYNEDEWLGDDSRGWKNFKIKEGVADKDAHGTAVSVSALRVPLYPNQAPNFRGRFGIRYGPHLESNSVEISVNSRPCEPAKPELRDGTRREISIDLPYNRKITGWVGVLEKRSVKGDYGIHLYWRGRLVKAFAKFGIRNHPAVAGVVGGLSLDHVSVNFHKTGFIEEAPEYSEAAERFRRDPSLAGAIRACSPAVGAGPRIQDVLGGGPAKPVEARMGIEKAESFMRGAKDFTAERGGLGVDVKFAEGSGGIYEAEAVRGGVRVTVERDSAAFRAFRNPLLLLGLIGIEAELLASGPRDPGAFVRERNRRWSEFVGESVKRSARPARPSEAPPPAPDYSLSAELVDLHDGLTERFGHRFQFTAASTLSPFMRVAHKSMVYTVHTVRGAVDQMYDALGELLAAEWGKTDGIGRQMFAAGAEPVALVNPSSADVYTALGLGHDSIFVIRESSERLAGTWAPPEKAWLDLYREVARGITAYASELEWVLEELVVGGIASPAKIRAAANRRKMAADVEPYLQKA